MDSQCELIRQNEFDILITALEQGYQRESNFLRQGSHVEVNGIHVDVSSIEGIVCTEA